MQTPVEDSRTNEQLDCLQDSYEIMRVNNIYDIYIKQFICSNQYSLTTSAQRLIASTFMVIPAVQFLPLALTLYELRISPDGGLSVSVNSLH